MFEKYRVTGKGPVVAMITKALESCGVQILRHPDIRSAPFEYTLKLPGGERIELVCYAFLANKYRQKSRPPNEHRFQVKYGNEFDRPHEIYIDPAREVVTLFMGVHLEEGIFIACDPAMHTPTWFSSSVEFKTEDIEPAKRTGWTAWERERSSARRRAGRDAENYQTETLVAFTSQHMLRFIQFERLATGLDAGERLLFAEKMVLAEKMAIAEGIREGAPHPLELQFGLSAREILEVIWGRFRLNVAVRGGVAEYHLGSYLRSLPEITKVREIDQDGKPDFEITFNRKTYLIECKNVLRSRRADGKPVIDFQKTRAAKGNPCSRYYDRDAFDVLAACLHPVTERWEFRFVNTSALPAHAECIGKLSHKVVVDGSGWTNDIRRLLVRCER